jgi:dipeptidyl aminopeptidase/acylaminoacyl peptidase
MRDTKFRITVIAGVLGLWMATGASQAGSVPQRPGRAGASDSRVFKSQITPHWFAQNTRFWYRNILRHGASEFILVDAEKGTREQAFDHAQLAAALSKAAGTEYQGERLPFDTIAFSDDMKTISFQVSRTPWRCDLATYEVSRADLPPSSAIESPQPARTRAFEEITPETEADGTNLAKDPPLYYDSPAPDGRWTAAIKDHNIVLLDGQGQEVQLTRDGVAGHSYGMLFWSPDSKTIVASRIEPGAPQSVYLIQSTPPEGGRARLRERAYPLPGDKYTAYELWVFDVESRQGAKVDAEPVDFYGPPKPRWSRDGKSFLFQKTDRGHQRFRVFKVETQTGRTQAILDDKSDTFINTTYDSFIYYTEGNKEILYASERDGWKHLYLVDANQATIKPVTQGPWVVRGVTRVDEAARQIWFRGSGRNPDQDPYLIHHYRVNFDGTGFVALTEGNGSHTLRYAPDEKYYIDTYSRVDLAPVNELRRTSDGRLMCRLEEADINDLKAGGWAPPEVFVAKGRDDQTDIWGIIIRPRDFDPNKKYPILEDIYAGPHDSYVPKTFSSMNRYASFTDLGFIVVKIDGMGTANRSKAFHDVCWHNLKDAGFPDRIKWIQAAAQEHPSMDVTRVGVYGVSAGGQNAAGAVLFHPEFYQAAVANCGCHDNRMDKASWNEQWMGYPVGPWYAESSNIENAAKLQGCLFLIVGELDTNVPPENTLRFADALIRAGKDFDYLAVPNGGHGAGNARAYVQRRTQDFFLRHLMGIEPPNHNAPAPEGSL